MDNVACHFVYYTGPRKGDAENFLTARITIGKAANNDFRLDGGADQVAPHHAEILLEDDNVYCLYDLGSKAGTYVNGERVHERCVLMNEDYIRFSQDGPEIIFRTGQAPAGKQKLPLVFPVTAELEFFSGSDAGRIFPINAAVITNIGRRAELEVPLDPRGDMIVSGNHCNIRYVEGHFVLSDSSRNGTYVNGDLVETPMEIIDGDAIMMGDGGPQARFRVDLAKRHYPNHRPLSPVVKPAKPEPSVSAMPPAVTPKTPVFAADTKPLASAAPFATGTKQPPPPEPPVAEPAPAAAPEDGKSAFAHDSVTPITNDSVTTPTENAKVDADLDDDFDELPAEAGPVVTATDSASGTAAAPAASALAGVLGRTRSSMAGLRQKVPTGLTSNFPHKLNFKPGKKWILGAVGLVVIIGIIAALTNGNDKSDSEVQPGDYATALQELKTVESPDGFSVKLPENWTALNEGGKVSAESNDKAIAVDYLRDSRLDEDTLRKMLGKNDAQVEPNAQDSESDGVKIKTMRSEIGSVRRIAVLHQPGNGGPAAAALMETTEEALKKIDDKTLNKLLVSNLTLTELPAVAAASPVVTSPPPTPAVASPAPAQSVSTPPPPTETAEATPPPVSEPAPIAAPASDNITTKTVASKALKLNVVVPETWKTSSEEKDEMLTLADNDGLEIRIARDEGDLDPEGTFKAMVKEGWNQDGVKSDPRFRAAQFSKSDQYLLLVLIPEKAKTTLVVYATNTKDFTEAQRKSISNVILQIVPE